MKNNRHVSDYIKIQRSRELRLWIATGLAAVVSTVTYLDNHPEVKRNLEDRTETFLNRFRKNPRIRVYPPTNQN